MTKMNTGYNEIPEGRQVFGDFEVPEGAALEVFGDFDVEGNLHVDGIMEVYGDLHVEGEVSGRGSVQVMGVAVATATPIDVDGFLYAQRGRRGTLASLELR
jgi:hypothetical protein